MNQQPQDGEPGQPSGRNPHAVSAVEGVTGGQSLPPGKSPQTRLQHLATHQIDFIKSFQAGSYFRGTEKLKIGWNVDEFAAANALNLLDPAVPKRYEQLLRDARHDLQTILSHIPKAPVWWEKRGPGQPRPRVVLKHLPLSCDFVIPATAEDGSPSYPSIIFRTPVGARAGSKPHA